MQTQNKKNQKNKISPKDEQQPFAITHNHITHPNINIKKIDSIQFTDSMAQVYYIVRLVDRNFKVSVVFFFFYFCYYFCMWFYFFLLLLLRLNVCAVWANILFDHWMNGKMTQNSSMWLWHKNVFQSHIIYFIFL